MSEGEFTGWIGWDVGEERARMPQETRPKWASLRGGFQDGWVGAGADQRILLWLGWIWVATSGPACRKGRGGASRHQPMSLVFVELVGCYTLLFDGFMPSYPPYLDAFRTSLEPFSEYGNVRVVPLYALGTVCRALCMDSG